MGFIALSGSAWISNDVASGYCLSMEAIHAESIAKNDIKMDISKEMVKLLRDKRDHVYLQAVVNDAKTSPFSVLTLIVCAQFQFQSWLFHTDPVRGWHHTHASPTHLLQTNFLLRIDLDCKSQDNCSKFKLVLELMPLSIFFSGNFLNVYNILN